jgi:polar amino acid transport system substrate-binding protein
MRPHSQPPTLIRHAICQRMLSYRVALTLLIAGLGLPWIFFVPAMATESALPNRFIMGANTEATSLHGSWNRKIYIEAFRRLGIPLEVRVAPLKRLELMIGSGEIDGEMSRAPAYALQHPELLQVDVVFAQVVFSLYALQNMPGVSKLEDLRNTRYNAIYRRGVVLCEKELTPLLPARQISATNTAQQGVAMLKRGHGDFFCDVSSSLENEQYSQDFAKFKDLKKLFDISKPVPLNPYLAHKHLALLPLLSATLKQMEKEGLIKKYRHEAELQMQVLYGVPSAGEKK